MRAAGGEGARGRRMVSMLALASLMLAASLVGAGRAAAVPASPIVSFTASLAAPNLVTLSWETVEDSSGVAYIYGPRINPQGFWGLDVGYTMRDASFTQVPGTNQYQVSFRTRPGTHAYTLQVPTADGGSDTARVSVEVAGPPMVTVTSERPTFVDMFAPADVTISWDSHGADFVRVARRGAAAVTSTTGSHVVPAAELTAMGEGRHLYTLTPCMTVPGTPGGFCGEEAVTLIHIGGARFTGAFLREFLPTVPAEGFTVSWEGGGQLWELNSESLKLAIVTPDRSFTIPAVLLSPGQHKLELRSCGVAVHSPTRTCSVNAFSVVSKELIIGEGVWTERQWTQDFDLAASQTHETNTLSNAGLPLAVTVDSRGDAWSVGEWADSMVQLADSGTVRHEVPLRRNLGAESGLLEKVRPFTFPPSSRVWVSGWQEDIVEIEGDIWFSQGGYGGAQVATPDHGRLVRFDPDGVDSPATETDERFCVYNLPEDDNSTVGIAWDGSRIWYTEARSGQIAVLGSFDPDELACDNFLDYEDPAAVSGAAHQYCTAEAQTGCIRRIDLPELSGAAHLQYDAHDNALWITGYMSQALGRYDLATDTIETFHAPKAGTSKSLLGTMPWQIEVDADYVYFNEYGDSDLLRFDKSKQRASCTELDLFGQNPCMDQIHLPIPVHGEVHSLNLHDGKLWFTASGGPELSLTDSGFIGYVETSDWGPGVVYREMGPDLVAPERGSGYWSSYTGIAVRPTDGTVFVNDYRRRQVLELRPRSATPDPQGRGLCPPRRATPICS